MSLLLPRLVRFLWPALGLAADASAAGPLVYNRDVRPILSDNCFQCHGPDAANRKGHRRLDTNEGATAERQGFRAFVPGRPDQSEAWLRLTSADDDEVMPPPDAHKTVTAEQKEILRRWIAEGASYERHWSYEPLRPVTPPAVKNESWVRNPVDRFILARLEREGLAPSPPADLATLLRRLSFDLTGLPPTPESVAAFVSQPSTLNSQLSVLFASPHYGERMASDWLDAARYADTNGYQVDRDRELHAWRDWVIRAFNDNMPFDQFTVEQLAGDLLPNATLEQKIATGFNRNHILNEEGGVIAEEFLAEATADRVETVATAWLGQTFNCTRCHDHKFDPFTQRDFYSLKAFFNNLPETGKGTYAASIRRNAPPMLRLPAPSAEAKLAELEREREAAVARLPALAAAQSAAELQAWGQRLTGASVVWIPAEIVGATAPNLDFPIDAARRRVQISALENRVNRITLRVKASLTRATAVRLSATGPSEVSTFSFHTVSTTAVVNGKPARNALPLRAAAAADSVAVAAAALLVDQDRGTRLTLAAAADRPADVVFEIEGGLVADGGTVELQVALDGIESTGPTSWEVHVTDADPALLAPAAVVAAAASAARTAAEVDLLRAHRALQLPAHRQLSDRIATLAREIKRTDDAIPTTLVMAERAEPRATHILMRGAYDNPGERVFPATPAILPPMDPAWPRTRLGLARWLVSPENPLPARVTVNRLWQLVFGTGLVRTAGDFGSQGEWPSHPELLDWLAQEFIRSGWDVRSLLRLLVSSATYAQSSRFTSELLARDSENRLLARASRFRLPAEAVRDSALAVSGLLVPTIGGPSVKPYHPPGLYEQVTAGTGTTVYVPGTGADLHRRTLYTYWKRSVPHPALLAFDLPFRETCTLQRVRTNTPLQALNLMNDPTYVEAARMLAHRMLREGGADSAARLAHGFHRVLARAPRAAELDLLVRAQARSQRAFATDPAATAAYVRVGATAPDATFDAAELASYAAVAGTILCMDEAVSRN